MHDCQDSDYKKTAEKLLNMHWLNADDCPLKCPHKKGKEIEKERSV